MAKKSEAMAMLEDLALDANRKQYPNMPDVYRPRFKYSDKTANGLTKCIVDFLRFQGHQAERIAGKIEVKIGADRQSAAQAAYQNEIEKAGGIYYIARTFTDFLQWYELTTMQLNLGETPLSVGWRKREADAV